MKVLILLVLSLIITSCANQATTEEATSTKTEAERPIYGIIPTIPNFMSVSPELFQELYDTKEMVVIDIRTPSEIGEGKIFEEALEIDFYAENFRQEIQKLDRNKKYLIYCRSGNRSRKALSLFDELGFQEVYDLSGGKNKWDEITNTKKTKNLITGNEKIIEINAEMYKFGTTEIHVKKDEKVVIKINNLDTTHGINIPDLNQRDDNKILLDTSKVGVFPFSCNNLCGIGHLNMQGKIIIK